MRRCLQTDVWSPQKSKQLQYELLHRRASFLPCQQLSSREKSPCLFHIQTSRGSPGGRSGFDERVILPLWNSERTQARNSERTQAGASPSSYWVVTVWQWSEQELHVNSSRHLAKSISLQSMGLFLLKSKDKLSETRYYVIVLVMQMKTDFWFYYLCHSQITFHNYIKNQLNYILFVWFFLLQIYELYFLWPGSDLESIPPYVWISSLVSFSCTLLMWKYLCLATFAVTPLSASSPEDRRGYSLSGNDMVHVRWTLQKSWSVTKSKHHSSP